MPFNNAVGRWMEGLVKLRGIWLVQVSSWSGSGTRWRVGWKAVSEKLGEGDECVHHIRHPLPPHPRTLPRFEPDQTRTHTIPLSVEGKPSTGQALYLLSTSAKWRAGYVVAIDALKPQNL